jgi:regulator of PEP synthase PpsR (kinase-PPPase family)
MSQFHLHLVSDATGETLQMVARAAITQFADSEATEHHWTMIRTERQLNEVVVGLVEKRGIVLYTLVDETLRRDLEKACRRLNLVAVDVLMPAIRALGTFLHAESKAQPGIQHVLDEEYFERIEAMQFTLTHDDGQSMHDLNDADVVLVGVSRTSKTPTSMYLANRSVRTANVPLVPGQPLPEELENLKGPLVVGLTTSVKRLVQIRRNRMQMLNELHETDYTDEDAVKQEVAEARRLFNKMGWEVIDVAGRSIEEASAAVLAMLAKRQESGAEAD